MAKKTTPKTSETVVAPVETPIVAEAPKEKKVKAPKTPKVEAAPAPAPASTPLVDGETTVVPVDGEAADSDDQLNEQSLEFVAKLQQLGTIISSLKTEYRALEKKWTRELKTAQKLSSKRKRKAGNRAPSGFVKPTRISDELSTFLAKPVGSEMARTEVTREINKYIRTNNLQDKTNGRKINPDAKLASLLKLKKTDELTYFNLQKFMSPHFAKANKEVVTSASATA